MPREAPPPIDTSPTVLLTHGPLPAPADVRAAVAALRRDPADSAAARVLLRGFGPLLMYLCKAWAPSMDREEAHALAVSTAVLTVTSPDGRGLSLKSMESLISQRVERALRLERVAESSAFSGVTQHAARIARAIKRMHGEPGRLTRAELTAVAYPEALPATVQSVQSAFAGTVPTDAVPSLAATASEESYDLERQAPAERLMARALERLPDESRVLACLFYGLLGAPTTSSMELAVRYGVPVATMQKRLTRIRDAIKEALANVQAEDAAAAAAAPEPLVCRLSPPSEATATYRREMNRRFQRAAEQLADDVMELAGRHRWPEARAVSAVARIVAERQRVPDEALVLAAQGLVRQAFLGNAAAVLPPVPSVSAESAPQVDLFGFALAESAAPSDAEVPS